MPSPDGKWAEFSVTVPAYDVKDQSSDLWIVPLDGSNGPRQLTQSKSGESGIARAPDGERIAFSAKREGDEAAQIYLLNVKGSGQGPDLLQPGGQFICRLASKCT